MEGAGINLSSRSAATEHLLQLLNSSALASSLSNWGRWISAALHYTSLRVSPVPSILFLFFLAFQVFLIFIIFFKYQNV